MKKIICLLLALVHRQAFVRNIFPFLLILIGYYNILLFHLVYRKNLLRSANEIDATGAGDAFLSVFVKNYYENYKTVDHEFIDNTFREATILTSDVVQHIGARGHIYEKTLEEIKQKNKEKEDKEIEYEL